MKKYLILLSIFLLTGCFGNVGKGELTSICTKTIKTEKSYEQEIFDFDSGKHADDANDFFSKQHGTSAANESGRECQGY